MYYQGGVTYERSESDQSLPAADEWIVRWNVDEEHTASRPSLLGLEDVDCNRAKDATQGDRSNHELQDGDERRIKDVHCEPLEKSVGKGWPC